MDFMVAAEIRSELDRTKKLLESQILWDAPTVLFRRSVLIEVLINLKDLLVKADKLGNRIAFTDDINPDPALKITDVTGLISNFRDAACHSDSNRHMAQGSRYSFNETRGKGSISMGGVLIGSGYDDDIAFNIGQHTLYLKRHIERAFSEVEAFLEAVLASN